MKLRMAVLAFAMSVTGSLAAADPAAQEAPVLTLAAYGAPAAWSEQVSRTDAPRGLAPQARPALNMDKSMEKISATLSERLEQRMMAELGTE